MATRQELLDCLRDLIAQAAKDHETDLALGREVSVPLSGLIADARPTGLQLSGLVQSLEGIPELEGLGLRAGWRGNREQGESVVIITTNA